MHHTAALGHDFGLQRRQLNLPSQCSSQCASFSQALITCVDDACACPTIVEYGPACVSCLATVFPGVASIVTSGIQRCQTSTLVPTSCTSECDVITRAAWQCIAEECYCSVLLEAGPSCSECWATLSGTSASYWGFQITGCGSEYPNIPTGSNPAYSGLPNCYAWCNPIAVAVTTCSENRCYCQVILGAAQKCSECWAPSNTAEASF